MDNNEEGSQWPHIFVDFVGLILQRLPLVSDYLPLRAVCSQWRATIALAIAGKHCTPPPQLPRPLFQTNDQRDRLFSISSLSSGRVYKSIRTPFEKDQSCHGTVEGWMIMSELSNFNATKRVRVQTDLRTIFFLNPVKNTRVYLPSKLKIRTPIYKIVASSKPTDPQCLVVCVFCDSCTFAFTKVKILDGKKIEGDVEADDNSWTLIGDVEAGVTFTEVEILDGKLYALTDTTLDSILVYDLEQKPIKGEILAKLPPRPDPIHSQTFGTFQFIYGSFRRSLAVDASSSPGELYLIYLFYTYKSIQERESQFPLIIGNEYSSRVDVRRCQVFRMDMSTRNPKWVEVDKVEDRSFFVSDHKSSVVSTTAIDGSQELTRQNCIYYILSHSDKWGKQIQIGRHCFTQGCITCSIDACFKLENLANEGTSMWFIPYFW